MTAASNSPPETPEGRGWPIVVMPPVELADGRLTTFPAFSTCGCNDCQEVLNIALSDAPRDVPRDPGLPW